MRRALLVSVLAITLALPGAAQARDRGAGTYRVRWQKFGGTLGPPLTFKR
jgi:hypothetical protein